MKILVSACLLGYNCKYNGLNNLNEEVCNLEFELVPFCPEVSGGLLTPRIPAEINQDNVYNKNGLDVTKEYNLGARNALNLCLKEDIKYAILKEKSPSCGVNRIYDGTFTGKLIDGSGFTTRLLRKNKIKVFSETEIDLLLKEIRSN